jgi:hypothetical protein
MSMMAIDVDQSPSFESDITMELLPPSRLCYASAENQAFVELR